MLSDSVSTSSTAIVDADAISAGVNPRGADYPFVSPSSDIRGLLADAYLSHPLSVTLPLHISWIAGLGAAFQGDAVVNGPLPAGSSSQNRPHPVDVVIRDATNFIVFNSREASYEATDFGDRFRIHEWQNDNSTVCRIVQFTQFHQLTGVFSIPDELIPVNGILDARVNSQLPLRLTTLRVGNYVVNERVILQNGYNTTLTRDEAQIVGRRNQTRITLNAAAGTGFGRFNNCGNPDTIIRSINRVAPTDRGDFFFSATGCYWVRQPAVTAGEPLVATPTDTTLQLGNDCGPCCTCEDYVDTYEQLRSLSTQYAAIGDQTQTARDRYHEMRLRWLTAKACAEAHAVTIAALTHKHYLEFSLAICNVTAECVNDIEVMIDVEVNGASVTPLLVPHTTFRTAIGGKWEPYDLATCREGYSKSSVSTDSSTGMCNDIGPPWFAYWDALAPGGSGRLKTRLEFQPGMRDSITISAQGWIGGLSVGIAEETVRLVVD